MTEVLTTQATTTQAEGQATAQTLMTDTKAPEAKVADAQGQQKASPAKEQSTGKPEAAQDKATTTDKPQGAPEKYEFKPVENGRDFDPEVLNAYSAVAKELNLTQEAAQKMLDRISPVMQERQAQQIEAVKSEWVQNARIDKEFGGDKLSENLSVAKKALDTFGSPELRTLLNESGLGNHPEIIRLMYRAGKAISEDRFVAGSQGNGKPAGPKSFGDLASALYSNQQ